MLRYIRNSKLRHQIILTSLICLIIPFGFVVYISGMFTNNLIKEQAVTNASESLKLVKLQLQNTIQGLFSIANHLEFDSSITPFLKSGNYKDTFYRGTYNITERINSLTHDKDGVFVTVLTPDQRFYTNYLLMNQFTPLQFMEEPWFRAMDQLPAYQNKWLGIQPNYVENQQERNPQVITFVRTLRTSGTRPYAYLVVSISEKRISELFEAYKEQTILLVDDHGRILAGQEGVGETFPHLNVMNEHSAKESPVISIDGVSYLYAMEKMPYENWSIVSLIPYDDAVSKANRIYWINFLWQVGFMVLFVTILIYLLRQFTKPLVALSRVAASIEADRLSVRSGIRGENEVGMLAKSFDKMLDRVEGMVEEITTEQENKRKAELSMLQAQIHPHFLFNILNSIRMKIWLRGDRESADLLSSLSRLLRMTIQRQDRMVRLDEEISISVEYMVLMQVTLREPFHYETELAPETLDVMMPRFVLQPIIENALIHGLEKGSGTICITSEIQEDLLIVTVSDDGQGIPPDQLEELNRNLRLDTNTLSAQRQGMSGIGMNNVYHRLQLIYGKDSDMRIDSSPGEGTNVQLYIPWKGWDTYDESTAG